MTTVILGILAGLVAAHVFGMARKARTPESNPVRGALNAYIHREDKNPDVENGSFAFDKTPDSAELNYGNGVCLPVRKTA